MKTPAVADDGEWEGEVTWCEDHIHDEDVEYIRFDLVQQKQLTALKGQLDELAAKDGDGILCHDCMDTGWLENSVEGKYVCPCIRETEPYQELQKQLTALKGQLERTRDWFEVQARGVSQESKSSWDLMILRAERNAIDEVLKQECDRQLSAMEPKEV